MKMHVPTVLLMLVVLAQGESQFVQWFEMKPAKSVHNAADNTFHDKLSATFKEWNDFKAKHGKQYSSPKEEMSRFAIFKENLEYITQHNHLYNNGKKSYSLGVNQFADMKTEEFRMYNGLRRNYKRSGDSGCGGHLRVELFTAPDTVDWRSRGYVTPVKNQGQCGSCWSFSTTGSLEGQHFRMTRKLLSLSEQQLVDCSGKFGNEGCNGGLMDQAFKYVMAVKGIESEGEYPYDAKQERCHFNRSEVVATCRGCVDVESGSEDDLKNVVAEIGPVSVAIDASHQSFQLYKEGVYDEPDCSSTELDHGVLTVGYGTADGGQDYWLVKNSWGTTWGEDGYVKMTRNSDNQCGIATQASYPLV